MPNIEWAVAHTLKTPFVNLDLNTQPPGERYLIDSDSYKMIPSLRVTTDNLSEADGSQLHPRWKTGIVATLKLCYWMGDTKDGEPACGATLRTMHEQLVGALNSITSLTGVQQRLMWQPTGYGDQRMLDQIQVLAWPDPSYDLSGLEGQVTFSVETPFPYALDATELQTVIGGSSGLIVGVSNNGNADFSPVVRINGPTTAFQLLNLADLDTDGNPKQIVYDSTRPGGLAIPGGSYAEIDFFRGTVFRNGDGANLIAGVDPTQTDFWHLLTSSFLGGPNVIQLIGAPSGLILSNNAWA